MSNDKINKFIREIISLYRNHLDLRATLNIEDFLEHGEPQLAIETLCATLHVNEVYLSTEIGNELLLWGEDCEIGDNYFNVIPPLILNEDSIKVRLKSVLIMLWNINQDLNDLMNQDLRDFFYKLIDMIILRNEEISNKIYREIIRLSYLITGVDPSICLKMNKLVASHIEKNKDLLDKISLIVEVIKPYANTDETQQIFDFIKYNEVGNIVDGLCYLIQANNIFIDIKTFDDLAEIAIQYNCEEFIEPIIRRVKE